MENTSQLIRNVRCERSACEKITISTFLCSQERLSKSPDVPKRFIRGGFDLGRSGMIQGNDMWHLILVNTRQDKLKGLLSRLVQSEEEDVVARVYKEVYARPFEP